VKWEDISYIFSSKVRLRTLISLSKNQRTPKQLSEELLFALSHISRALKELQEKELVICLTPERRKGRFYQITEKGKNVLAQIKKILD